MRVRRADPEEAVEIADVWLRSRAASVPAIPPKVYADHEVRSWFRDVVLPTKEVWVIDDDDAVVALLVLEDDWIDQLYVDPTHTGCGLGTRLVEVAKLRRPRGLQLWTFQANDRARRFYERHGFIAMDTTHGDNKEGAPDVRYQWSPSDPDCP